jgi:hypothetical protein
MNHYLRPRALTPQRLEELFSSDHVGFLAFARGWRTTERPILSMRPSGSTRLVDRRGGEGKDTPMVLVIIAFLLVAALSAVGVLFAASRALKKEKN